MKKIYNFFEESDRLIAIASKRKSNTTYRYESIYSDKKIKIVNEFAIYGAIDHTTETINMSILSPKEFEEYSHQIIKGGFDKHYIDDNHIVFREKREILDVTDEEFKTHIINESNRIIKSGNKPNLSILKKVFVDEELRFYFPTLFPNEPSPPVFIDKAHIGDAKIAGGDIVDGTKVTGDSGMIKITDHGSRGKDSTEKPFTNCPYCGEALNLSKTPKFCPFCGEQLK